jgi:hypothetical protein
MRKRLLVTAAVASLLSIGAPSAFAATTAVTPANGNDVVFPDGMVYQENGDGSYSLIPNVATANAMGLNWGALQPVVTLPGPVSSPFPSTVAPPVTQPAVTPANGNDVVLPDGSVYQGNGDGTWSWIPDVATANAMGLQWNNLLSVDALPGPVGVPFTSVYTSAYPG